MLKELFQGSQTSGFFNVINITREIRIKYRVQRGYFGPEYAF